eukprot:6208784-Pleurochrysis_carterae.AAC.1
MVLLVCFAVCGALRRCAVWTAVAPFWRENERRRDRCAISAYNTRLKVEIVSEECDLHLRTEACRSLAYRG